MAPRDPLVERFRRHLPDREKEREITRPAAQALDFAVQEIERSRPDFQRILEHADATSLGRAVAKTGQMKTTREAGIALRRARADLETDEGAEPDPAPTFEQDESVGGASQRGLVGRGPRHTRVPARNPYRSQFLRATEIARVPASWVDDPNLLALIHHESSWDPSARNPNSTAWGLFQFLRQTSSNYGIPHGQADVFNQAAAGLRYIKDRYGSPAAAWRFWLENGWY